jgi:hypothetical protein
MLLSIAAVQPGQQVDPVREHPSVQALAAKEPVLVV